MANQVTVVIDVDNKDAQKALKNFVKTTKGVEKGVIKSFSKMDGAIASFAGNLAANLAAKVFTGFISGVKGIGKAAVDQASKVEDLTTQIGTLTGSVEDAEDILASLQQFAATTPFQLVGLAESTKLLLAFGNAQEDIIPTLQVLGDVAAGSGNDLQDLTRIFGQIQAEGKLTGERFKQLAERAVPIGPAIAKTLGVAESAVKDLVSKGAVDIGVFTQAFNSLNKEGGQFANGMIRQSKTLSGVLSTLNDNVDLLLVDLGNELLPIIKDVATQTIDWIQANRDLLKSFATDAVGQLKTALEGMLSISKDVITFFSDAAEAASGAKMAFEEFAGVVDTDTISGAIVKFNQLKDELEETEKKLVALNEAPSFIQNTLLSGDIERAQEKIKNLGLELLATEAIIDGINKKAIADRPSEEDKDKEAKEKELKEEQERLQALRDAAAETERLSAEEALRIKNEALAAIKADQALIEEEARLAKVEADAIAEEEGALAAEEFLKNKLLGLEALTLENQAKELALQGKHLASIAKLKDAASKRDETRKKKDGLKFIKVEKARQDFEKKTWEEKLAFTSKGLDSLTSLMASENKVAFNIGKASAIAQALITIPSTAVKAFNSLAGIPVVGPALGGAAAAASVAAGILQVNKIRSQQPPKFQGGGVVPGNSFSGDNVNANLNSGELILNRQQQSNLFSAIDTGSISGGGTTINVEGNVIADNDQQVDDLIFRINDAIEFRNVPLITSREVLA